MLAAKVAFPVVVFFLASLASEARYHSRPSRLLGSSDEDRSSSHEAREHLQEEQDWHFELCHFVNAWKKHLGHVSVLAFLDPSWQYSFRQAVMLELLSTRLRKSGFPDIRFFVISPFSDSTEENKSRSEDDLEIETWREIEAKYEMESFVDEDFLKGNGSEIIFLQDDPQSRIWERFHASREQAIVIDRCGKLTYHVIVPWSILFFPYVKAAILSTYKEDPCGGCDPAIYRARNHEDQVVKLTKGSEEETSSPTHRETDTKPEVMLTTESLENATIYHDQASLEEQREASTAFSTLLEEITNDTDRPDLSTESPTESTTYDRYDNDATEFQFEDTVGTQDQEDLDLENSENGGTVPSKIATTFEPDVLSSEKKESDSPANNNSLILANHGDTTDPILLRDDDLMIGVTESDSTSANEETTTSSFRDEIRDNTTPENAEHFGEDAFLPLRIIMYAPHVHKNGKKTKKHTHLILKTGDPDYHGHADSRVDIASPAIESSAASSEEYDWGTTEADADEGNTRQTYTFGGNESPGLYGEVADYWKSYEDDIADRNETFNDTYDNSTTNYNEQHRSNVNNHATSLSEQEESYSNTSITEDPSVGSSTDLHNIVGSNTIESSRPINANNQVSREEEMRYKLMEHYILSWIDYRLNK